MAGYIISLNEHKNTQALMFDQGSGMEASELSSTQTTKTPNRKLKG